MIPVVGEYEQEVKQQQFAVFRDERPGVVQAEDGHVQHERQMHGPVDFAALFHAFDDQVDEEHDGQIAPVGLGLESHQDQLDKIRRVFVPMEPVDRLRTVG